MLQQKSLSVSEIWMWGMPKSAHLFKTAVKKNTSTDMPSIYV